MKRQLILENGAVFVGTGFGSEKETDGEVIFYTGMTGYQEILANPSYCGQLVTFTYPLIGNYGINRAELEEIAPALHGLIVKEAADIPSNWKSEESLSDYLASQDIPGIAGIDTRKLTRIIRQHGTLRGAICSVEQSVDEVVNRLRNTSNATDLVKRVSVTAPFTSPGSGFRVALIDFGRKQDIVKELNARDCDVVVVPYNTSAEDILQLQPQGVMLSNGPGNPEDVPEAIETIKALSGRVPIVGIGLGHQLFALACGAKVEKLTFGHRGSNHPVKDLETGAVSITTQNHGYVVQKESLEHTKLRITHVALNDGTVEGLKHEDVPAYTIQYYPDTTPGNEASNLFDEFLQMMKEHN